MKMIRQHEQKGLQHYYVDERKEKEEYAPLALFLSAQLHKTS